MSRTKRLVVLGLLLGIEVVLSRFLSISTPIVKIGFAFIPIALAAMLFGPVWAGATAALADFLGAVLFPIGPYFPGFTLSAFLTGVIFGLFLYQKTPKWWRPLVASLTVGLICTAGLGSIWLSMLWDEGVLVLLPARMMQLGIMVPLQVVVINLLCYRIGAWLEKSALPA